MGALILKSGNALNANVESFDFTDYKNRVLADGGVIVDAASVQATINDINQSENLSPDNVFSLTHGGWGVKFSNGLPVRFYSLFNPLGDVILDVQASSLVSYEDSLYSFPVVRFGGMGGGTVLNNGYSTVGTFDALPDVAIAVVTKNTSPLGTTGYRFVTYPKDTPNLASTNKYLGRGDTGTGLKTLTVGSGFTTNQNVTTQADLLAWDSTVLYRDSTKVDVIKNGVTSRSITANTPTDSTALTLDIGRSVIDNASAIKYSSTMKADFAEAWVLTGVTKAAAEELSAILAAKYV